MRDQGSRKISDYSCESESVCADAYLLLSLRSFSLRFHSAISVSVSEIHEWAASTSKSVRDLEFAKP